MDSLLAQGSSIAASGESGPLGPVVGTIVVAIIAIGIIVYWIRRAAARKK